MLRRTATTAALAVLVLVVGQVAALAHEASTRHVVCPEHGEQLEAVTLLGAHEPGDSAHLVGVDGATGEHADCAIVHALRTTAVAPHAALFALLSAGVTFTALAPPPRIVLAFARYRIAPKTSPPRAV